VFNARETERFSMLDGTIGHTEVMVDDSVIMIAESTDEEYTEIHLYVE
jgi:hypothetical protein